MAPDEDVTLILDAEALASGKLIVRANVSSDTYESDLSNNNVTAEKTVTDVNGANQKLHSKFHSLLKCRLQENLL